MLNGRPCGRATHVQAVSLVDVHTAPMKIAVQIATEMREDGNFGLWTWNSSVSIGSTYNGLSSSIDHFNRAMRFKMSYVCELMPLTI
jgi:hypothetical protein